PNYGTMFISFANYNLAGPPISVTRSTDGGATWSAPVNLTLPAGVSFVRNVQDTGSPGGTFFIAAMNENGGALNPRTNYIYRSTWATPLKLNQDTTTNGNWQPSVAVTTQGAVLVSWYDGRNGASASCGSPGSTTACYQRWGRVSLDNGATWQPDEAISDAVS